MTAPVGFAAYADIDLPDLRDPHQWFPNGPPEMVTSSETIP